MSKRNYHLSASAIWTFKKCPIAWRNAYLYGMRPIKKKDSLFDGTNWHDGLELISLGPEAVCRRCAGQSRADHDCPICLGSGFLQGDPMEAVARCYEKAYSTYNLSEGDAVKVETTRTKLLYSLSAYKWYWEDQDEIEVLGREIPFDLPLIEPRTGVSIPDVRLVGKIDKLVRWKGRLYILEHKSTADDINPESPYWNKLRFDVQTRIYPYAAQQLQRDGELKDYGVKASEAPISGVLYDAWHKPGIGTKKITQAEAKKIFTEGQYCEQLMDTGGSTYESILRLLNATMGDDVACDINGERSWICPAAPNKKTGKITGFALRENQSMYGARLMQDLTSDPEKYFQRKEITRTAQDLKDLEVELVSVYHTMRFMERYECWYKCERECEAFGKCDYMPCCYDHEPIGPDVVPAGFKCTHHRKEN